MKKIDKTIVPVKEGEEYDVEIIGDGSRYDGKIQERVPTGDGIAKVDNFVVIVPNKKKGDKCKIKITAIRNIIKNNGIRSSMAFGEVVEWNVFWLSIAS